MKNWVEKKLDEVCELITCGVAAKPQYVNDGIPFLSAKNVKEGQIIWSGYNCISEKTHKELTRNNKPLVGDILYTRVGSYGEAAVIEDDKEFSVFVSLTLIKVDKSVLNNYFLKHYLNSDFIKRLAKKSISGSGVGNLNVGTVRDFPILLPPLPEQQRIVASLDEVFAAINKAKSNAEQNLKNAKELFESYLQRVFENKGEDWEEKRLEEICVLISKGSSPKWQGIKYVDEPGVLFVTSENVGENTLLLEQRKYVEEKFNISDKKSILKNGDVLTNIVGASIGRTAIFDLDDIANINQAVCLIRCNKEVLFNEYLMYLLNSPFTKQHLHDNEVNSARANLSLGFFRSLSIPLPKLNEQKEVVNKAKAFHIETQKLETIYKIKINDLEELKKSVLQKAFSGELKTAKALV